MAGFFSKRKHRQAAQPLPFCSLVLAAAGSSQRMGGGDKIMADLCGEPVIVHTLRALQQCPEIGEIIVVTKSELIVPVADLAAGYGFDKVKKVRAGGETRLESVRIGTLEVCDRAGLIAVHDGARPLVSKGVVASAVRAAAACNAAAPAVPVTDTVKRAKNGLVVETPDRAELYSVQTPQVFEASLLKAALQGALDDHAQLTDDCGAVERLGMTVTLTEGSRENIKITTPVDLAMAQAILEWRQRA